MYSVLITDRDEMESKMCN